MKNMFFALLAFVVLFSVGCDGSSNQNVDTPLVRVATPTPTPVSVEVTPNKIGVSAIKEEFVKFPQCDGGECYDITFTIGVEVDGKLLDAWTRYSARTTEASAGAVKTADEIKEGRRLHALISKLDPKQIRVTIGSDGSLQKIAFVGQMVGTTFIPSEILWDKESAWH